MSHVNVSSHCSVAIPSSAPGMCWAPPRHVSRYLKQSNRALAKFRHDSLVMLRNPFAAFHQILISFSAAFRQARQVCLDKAQAHGCKLSTPTSESTDFTQSSGFGIDLTGKEVAKGGNPWRTAKMQSSVRLTAHQHLLHTVAGVCPLSLTSIHCPVHWPGFPSLEMWCHTWARPKHPNCWLPLATCYQLAEYQPSSRESCWSSLRTTLLATWFDELEASRPHRSRLGCGGVSSAHSSGWLCHLPIRICPRPAIPVLPFVPSLPWIPLIQLEWLEQWPMGTIDPIRHCSSHSSHDPSTLMSHQIQQCLMLHHRNAQPWQNGSPAAATW